MVSANRTKKERVTEFCMYGAGCLVSAFVAKLIIFPPRPSVVTKRSDQDLALVRSALKIASSKPTIVEFMDFQCPPCRASWPKVRDFLRKHPEVDYRAVNFPLRMHPFAFGAAVASEVARSKGFYDTAFSDMFMGKCDLKQPKLNEYLISHGADPVVGTAKAAPFEQLVRTQMKLGTDMHIAGTPTILILSRSGTLSELHSLDTLDQVLE